MSDQSRNGNDLIALRQRGLFHQVDHLDRVAARQMLLAELLQVGDRGYRLGGLARHIEPEVVAVLFGHVRSIILAVDLNGVTSPLDEERLSLMAVRSAVSW